MSTGRKSKRARQCRDNDETREDHRLLSLFLSSVLVLSQSGHIGAKDLGRIGRTCSSLQHASLDEEAWACLCRRRWANTDGVPRSVIEARSYRWLYRRRAAGIPEATAEGDVEPNSGDEAIDVPPLPPPPARSSHENMVLLLDISVDGVSRLSEVFTGEALRPLLETGYVQLDFDRPIPLGKVGANGLIIESGNLGSPEVHANAHVLDLATNKCACLMDARSLESDSWFNFHDSSSDTPCYVFSTEGRDDVLSRRCSTAPLGACDKFKYRFDGPAVFLESDVTSDTPFPGCVPLESTTRALAERAISEDGGFEELRFVLEARQLLTYTLERFLGFDHVCSRFKESPLFDPKQPVTHATLANFEKEYWDKYLENNSFDTRLSSFLKIANELRDRFGNDAALVSNIELHAQRVEVGGDTAGPFYEFEGGKMKPFNGVTLHHLVDGLQGWDLD